MRTEPLDPRFRLAAPDPDRDLPAIARIISAAFAGGGYVDEILQTYIGNCHYDFPVSRLIWDGDRLAHHWGVWTYPMRLESLTLTVAGIGAVVTDEADRKHGLMRHAALASFDAMDAAGYDLTVLRGRHYVKYGYARAWNYVTYRLKPDETPPVPVPALPLKAPYRRLETADIPAMDAVYNRTHAAFTGTAVRPTYRTRSSEEIGCQGWFDMNGCLDGYVRALPDEKNPKQLTCLEAAGDPEQCLAVLADLFKQGSYETLAFFTLPHQHPVLQRLRRGDVLVEDRYFDFTGWRARIVNLRRTLGKLRPLLEQRLARSQFAAWEGSLFLDAGGQSASLAIKEGQVHIQDREPGPNAVRGGWDIVRFLIGSDEPGEIVRQAGMECTGRAGELLDALFPNLHPMMSHWDEY